MISPGVQVGHGGVALGAKQELHARHIFRCALP